MKGYHYTSWENWQEIQRVGLIPYPIRNPSIRRQFPAGAEGIFTWTTRPTGIAHYGQAIWVMIHHHTLSVVLISYEFERHEEYGSENGGHWTIKHDGELCTNYGKPWVYHKDEPAVLIKVPISPDRIALEAVYNFQDLMDKEDQGESCLINCSSYLLVR